MRFPRRHVDRMIAAYCDGRLPNHEARRVEAHLAQCVACRTAVEEFHYAAALLGRLPAVAPPDSLWHSIDAALAGPPPRERRVPVLQTRRFVTAAALVVVMAAGVYWNSDRLRQARWDVRRADNSGNVDRLGVGEWLQTGASSRLRINVGSIGFVDVEPNSRIRLGPTRASEHRLELALGEIKAQISAPPRLFFVDTPTSTVVDLGCAYTMRVDDAGAGRLRVTSGWASLEWQGREALVPAGAACQTRPGVGPGTPCFDDASPTLQRALLAFDFEDGGSRALDTVLAESRVRETLTLWHLLSRVNDGDRVRVFDRIVSLTPLPAGVTRDKALQLDRDTLKRWKEELAWTW